MAIVKFVKGFSAGEINQIVEDWNANDDCGECFLRRKANDLINQHSPLETNPTWWEREIAIEALRTIAYRL